VARAELKMNIPERGGARYDDATIVLHWLTAILVTLLWTLGQIIDWFPKGTPRISARSTHILLGAALLLVLCIRIFWRARSGSRLPLAVPGWLGWLGKATHHALYGLLVITVLLGALNVWSRGDKFYGLFVFPKLAAEGGTLKSTVEDLHALSANVLAGVALLHALAALGHHFIRRDEVLRRMLRR
jgi:cytochrome b561